MNANERLCQPNSMVHFNTQSQAYIAVLFLQTDKIECTYRLSILSVKNIFTINRVYVYKVCIFLSRGITTLLIYGSYTLLIFVE